jgi:hypothetical protein
MVSWWVEMMVELSVVLKVDRMVVNSAESLVAPWVGKKAA